MSFQGHPGLSRFTGHFPGPLNTPFTPRAEPSYEPFEPHRDKVRRDGITCSRHIPRGEQTNPRTPRPTLLDRCSPLVCLTSTPTSSAHTKQLATVATQQNLVLDSTRPQAEALCPRTHATHIRAVGPPRKPGQSAPGTTGDRAPNPRVAAITASRQVANTHPTATRHPR